MRKSFISLLIILLSLSFISPSSTQAMKKEIPIIIQVEGNPRQVKEQIKKQYPNITIVQVFDLLFTGLALKVEARELKDFLAAPFITSYFPVRNYQAVTLDPTPSPNYPEEEFRSPYTGKGVKVGIIDTGIDYNHPDLKQNYEGGYDLIDLDDDPMESLPEDGIATSHGSHVSGIVRQLAPDVKLYAYRALGPGGQGTSIQVIAALEKAVNDGMDILNLSLGNSINGPDFPTTMAVNKAIDLGLALVIANGNDGPGEWTVGSPATARKALSVGAAEGPKQVPYLFDSLEGKRIFLSPVKGSFAHKLYKDYEIVKQGYEIKNLNGKILLLTKIKDKVDEQIRLLLEEEVLALLIHEDSREAISEGIREINPLAPIFSLSEEDFDGLKNKISDEPYFISLNFKSEGPSVSTFSSKGPVIGSWQIKPDLLAPGKDIRSTIPGGYASYSGTSMAAPYATGAIALMKEAKRSWSNDQIIQALKTNASPLFDDGGEKFPAISQGMGLLNIEKSLETSIIIDGAPLSFGKLTKFREEKTLFISIENVSKTSQQISFTPARRKKGLNWDLPLPFSLKPGEKRSIPLHLAITTSLLEEGLHQGWIDLSTKEEEFSLPYLFMNKRDDYPKLMGFMIGESPLKEDVFTLSFYTAEALKSFQVDLFQADNLVHQESLIKLKDLPSGLYKEEVKKTSEDLAGSYLAIITLITEEGEIENYQEHLHF